jgi:hypothetical protein
MWCSHRQWHTEPKMEDHAFICRPPVRVRGDVILRADCSRVQPPMGGWLKKNVIGFRTALPINRHSPLNDPFLPTEGAAHSRPVHPLEIESTAMGNGGCRHRAAMLKGVGSWKAVH